MFMLHFISSTNKNCVECGLRCPHGCGLNQGQSQGMGLGVAEWLAIVTRQDTQPPAALTGHVIAPLLSRGRGFKSNVQYACDFIVFVYVNY